MSDTENGVVCFGLIDMIRRRLEEEGRGGKKKGEGEGEDSLLLFFFFSSLSLCQIFWCYLNADLVGGTRNPVDRVRLNWLEWRLGGCLAFVLARRQVLGSYQRRGVSAKATRQ